MERLKENNEAQAAGVKAMLKESHAREEEAVARLKLLETSSARDVALAKYEVLLRLVGILLSRQVWGAKHSCWD